MHTKALAADFLKLSLNLAARLWAKKKRNETEAPL